METLQSNKLIRRETDTPVRYRVTETEGTERMETWTIEGWYSAKQDSGRGGEG